VINVNASAIHIANNIKRKETIVVTNFVIKDEGLCAVDFVHRK
jgi:hypothetical protein